MSPRLSTLAASAALALPLLALAPGASYAVDDRTAITFEQDPDGWKEFGDFRSLDHAGVTFCTVGGAGWWGVDPGFAAWAQEPYSAGRSFFAHHDVGMTFAGPVDSLELSFGYDGVESPVQEAVLDLYLGETLVDTTIVTVNGDSLVNQTIGAEAGVPAFNRAVLSYEEAGDQPHAPMIVDNVLVGQPVAGAENPAVDCRTGVLLPTPEPQPEPVSRDCTTTGTPGGDVLVGTPERDVICGRGGDDVIKGLGGDDLLIGGPGHDRIRGHHGDDEVHGNAGADQLWGGDGFDTADGGAGRDLAAEFEVLTSAKVVDRIL